MTETLGQRIAQRRRMLSLSQEALGEKMGMSRQAISKWESDVAIPEVDRLIEMSKFFDVSVGWLLGTESQNEEAEVPLVSIIPTAPEPTPSLPDPEPAPQPPQEPSPRNPLAWIAVVSSVVAVVSLILAILAYAREIPAPIEVPDAQLSQEDKNYIASVMQDMEYIRLRNENIHEGLIERRLECDNVEKQLEALQAYVYSMSNASGLVEGPTEYEQFISWNLVGSLNSSHTKAKLAFSCQPFIHIGIQDVQLYILQGGTTVDYFNCILYEEMNIFYADFDLPLENGYRYEVSLVYDSGKSEQFELTGHGLSDLQDAAAPQVKSAQRASDYFSDVSYQEITLAAPALLPDTYQWHWHSLRLVHYHNGKVYAEHDITATIKDLYRKGDTLSFSLQGKPFSTSDSKDGDVHEIRLEGDLKITAIGGVIEPIYYEYSILLETWNNNGGKLTLADAA